MYDNNNNYKRREAMFKKLSTFLSLFVILSTFLVTPVTAMAEGTTNSSEASTAVTANDSSSSSTEKADATEKQQTQKTKSGEQTSTPVSDAIANKSSVKSSQAKPRAPVLGKEVDINGTGAADAKDDDGNPIDASDWISGDYYDVNYDWSIPDGTEINAGDTSTVQLPDGAVFAKDESFDIKDADGNVVGHFTAKAGESSGTITWSDYYEKHPKNRQGTIHFVPTGTKPAPTASDLAKNGWAITQLPDGHYSQIQWQLRVNVGNKTVSNAVVTDELQATDTQTLDTNSFKLSYTDGSGDLPAGSYTINATETGFTLKFNGTITKDITVMYTSTFVKGIPYLNDGTKMTFPNESHMTGHDENANSDIDADASKDVTIGEGGNGEGDNRGVILSKVDSVTGDRIPGVHFKLLDSDGNVVSGYEDLVTDSNGQIHVSNLAVGDYSFVETQAAPGYVINTDPVNFSITDGQQNAAQVIAKNVVSTEVKGTKTWDDNDNQDGKRPGSIKVNLLANGEVVQTKTVTADDNWEYSFTDLPKYDEDGKEIVYTITEDTVPDYNTHIDGYDLTNSYTPSKTSVSVTKKWDDNNNQDGIRPDSIKVQLYADGVATDDEVTLNEANNWTTTWNDLPQKKDGKDIVYSVKEVGTTDGYEATVDASNPGNIIITNKHKAETTKIDGRKIWDDNNNQAGKRPGSIKVNLLANGKVVQTKTVTADDNWEYSFTDLPKYEDGKEIVYTITEDKVAGYETEIHGYNIINHYTPQPTPINPDNPIKPDAPIKPSEPKLTPETPSKQAALPSTSAQAITVVPLVLLVLTLTTVVLVWFQKHHN